MSTDSSSSLTSFLNSPVVKATATVFGTIFVFLAGQLIGIFILISVLNSLGFNGVLLEDLFDNNSIVQFLSILLIESIIIGLIYSYYRFRDQEFLGSIGLKRSPSIDSFLYAIIAYVLYFITFVTIAFLLSIFIPSLDVDQSQQIGFNAAFGFDLVIVYASLVILPAIAEEIIFRGVLYQRLKNLIHPMTAAVVTSLVFGAAHLEFFSSGPLNWIAAIDTFVFSFFLIALVVKSKSLWGAIMLHAIKNSIAFVLLFII
ncbi:MAG: membrane protease YdiL (CAAX protease family) [Candidatus Saccharimonadales bacterium]|jgi:membrane protease YdiL (CAAX protease family)